jgi:hypothetical protein
VIPELQALKWAAHPHVPPPDVERLDEERLLGLIWQHRLAIRFRERTRDAQPPWWTRQIGFGVLTQCRLARQDLERRLAVTAEVAAALAETGKPLITVKGASTYALTGDERSIRHSADLDLMFHDMEALHSALLGLGFAGEPWKWAAHEYGEMIRGNFKIEPHLYFPVYAYPPGLPEDLVPKHHPDLWVQKAAPCVRRRIEYADLLPYCQPGTTRETRHLWIPGPSMAVLILCAHEFREYLQRPSRPALIQLSTLADICDLLGQAQFDTSLFLSLLRTFDGGDSVRLVQALIHAYFDVEAFPFLPEISPTASEPHPASPPSRGGAGVIFPLLGGSTAFPKVLSLYGAWAQVDDDPEALLSPLTTQSLLSQFWPDGRQQLIVQTLQDASQPPNAGLSFETSTQWRPKGLEVRVTLLTPLEEGLFYHLKLYSSEGINVYHNVSLVPHEHRLEQYPRDNVKGYLEGTLCHVQFSLPWHELPPMQQDKTLPVILVITQRRQDQDFADADPVIVAPLQISSCPQSLRHLE